MIKSFIVTVLLVFTAATAAVEPDSKCLSDCKVDCAGTNPYSECVSDCEADCAVTTNYAVCIKDCEAVLLFCEDLVSGGLPLCKEACESECGSFPQILNPFCKASCDATCDSDYSSGLTQCQREYQTCSTECRSMDD